jgi:hypothetical protein
MMLYTSVRIMVPSLFWATRNSQSKGTVMPVNNSSRGESLSENASQTVLENETLELTWKYFKILQRMHFYEHLNTMKERQGQMKYIY